MDQYKETFQSWNNVASVYEDKFMDLDLYNESYDYICNNIARRNAKILEIGCGPGNVTRYLLTKRPDLRIFGIDIAPNMIELAKKNNPAAEFAVMDSRQIHTLELKYDGIVSGFCLPYLSHDESSKLISDSYELLNENGLIYLSFVEGDPGSSGFKTGPGGRVFFYYHTPEEIQEQLVTTGFDEIKTFSVQYKASETEFDTHTIVIAKKGFRDNQV